MSQRIEGIDYLRAVMSVFVVIWHMGGGGRSQIFSREEFLVHRFTVSDFVNFHLLLLAVPTFVFISIYLYASKPISAEGLKKKLSRVLLLLSFWPLTLILYSKSYHGLFGLIPKSPSDALYTFLLAGNTIYYFFPSLIICVSIAHLFIQLSTIAQISIFVISIFLLIALPQLTEITGFFPLSAYWNPYNFLPLTFAAVLFARNKEVIEERKMCILLISVVLCALFSVFEWSYSVGITQFPGQGYAIPAYTRASLLFAVIALFTTALHSKIESGRLVRLGARYSLALYCLHPFLISPVKEIWFRIFENQAFALYASIISVILLSYCFATALKRYYLKEGVIM